MEWRRLVDLLKHHTVYLQTHNFPDPDALASAYGMQVFLKANGVDSTICYAGKIEKNSTKRMIEEFKIEAVHIDDLPHMVEEDYIVTIDAQKYNSNITDFIGNEVACIDHHPTTVPCAYEYSDIRICGACCSIVTDYFIESGTSMDSNTATALLYGLKMDTDSFNRGVTDFDIDMFAYLHKKADNQKIISMYNNNMEIEDLYAYGEAIRTIRIYENVGFAWISFDCPDGLIAMISDFILGLDIVEFSVVYALRDGGYKFSVRNETEIYHAGSITQKALADLGGGGGHFSMAGGVITKDKVKNLGSNPEFAIRERFLEAIRQEKINVPNALKA
ncbi:MAG: DHH family phosphoesterase [Bacteroidales bacterium]|nr:DHH family phosphoesterase [Clostridium sp.]MCM1204121.1 DHH family phosphoesterase [Bacteroidales bacterium]